MAEQKQTCVIVLKKFFGLKEGQSLKDFQVEVSALTPAEKYELACLAAPLLVPPVAVEDVIQPA